jgi:hypothetical protein
LAVRKKDTATKLQSSKFGHNANAEALGGMPWQRFKTNFSPTKHFYGNNYS